MKKWQVSSCSQDSREWHWTVLQAVVKCFVAPPLHWILNCCSHKINIWIYPSVDQSILTMSTSLKFCRQSAKLEGLKKKLMFLLIFLSQLTKNYENQGRSFFLLISKEICTWNYYSRVCCCSRDWWGSSLKSKVLCNWSTTMIWKQIESRSRTRWLQHLGASNSQGSEGKYWLRNLMIVGNFFGSRDDRSHLVFLKR